jgi:antitoxin CcdA
MRMASTSEQAMSYDRTKPKRAINVSLNDDLVRQARLYTRNLSGTLEDLLEDFVMREHARRRDEDAALDRAIGALNAFHAEHGLLADEFSAL